MKPWWCILPLAAALAPAGDSANPSFDLLPAATIQQRLETVPSQLPERRARLESLLREAGCDLLTTLAVPHSQVPDVICTLPGTDPEAGTIVLGAHYDYEAPGAGAVDDWSGAALLPSLYQSLKAQPRRHRLVFIGFAAEEGGLLGSRAYVHKLAKPERSQVRAMVNLECLGLSPPVVWASRADKRLLAAYFAAARALGIPPAGVNVDRVGDDDSHPFLDAKIPVLTIHSVTPETFRILHSRADQVAVIHPRDYYDAYRVAATFLAYIDSEL